METKMKKILKPLAFAAILAFSLISTAQAKESFIEDYTQLVHANYSDVLAGAQGLQSAVNGFLDQPTEESLAAAKQAWLDSRPAYGQSEAFRFQNGPIDFFDENTGAEGPEGRINAWPLNEAFIDYVEGNANAGLVNNTDIEITKDNLINNNTMSDESDVTTGYHAIEFLLWGQDFSTTGPGTRSHEDYLAGDEINERRRNYLKIVTDLLVEDIEVINQAWAPSTDNYAAELKHMDTEQTLSNILSAMATLSAFELASERMAVAVDGGDQEDEQSCFSDNTHIDFINNAKGVQNIYLGTYVGNNGEFSGRGISALVAETDKELDNTLRQQLAATEAALQAIADNAPVDQIIAAGKGSEKAQLMEDAIAALYAQTETFKQVGEALGVEVHVESE